MIRNKNLIKQVMKRDLGLCQCCGFKATEVHHIVPLVHGGTDELSNMISLCEIDHRNAPNTKEEFEEYMRQGGVRLRLLLSTALIKYYESEIIPKDFNRFLVAAKDIINILRNVEFEWALETYNVKEALDLK